MFMFYGSLILNLRHCNFYDFTGCKRCVRFMREIKIKITDAHVFSSPRPAHAPLRYFSQARVMTALMRVRFFEFGNSVVVPVISSK